jgi:hypothetical protein
MNSDVSLCQLKDFKGLTNFCTNFSSTMSGCALPGGGTEETIEVPDGALCCIISATGNYYVAADNPATIPSSGGFIPTFSMLNFGGIYLAPTQNNNFPEVKVLHFTSSDPVKITVAFYY